ncbi:unnamed protein product [Linum tenue]|uniref:NB-ARC domain-containing protein n=1 Tax=Linum tenue TaxID=586396 RepID=A0AAV0IHF7_9ROSI|nr:unnamed protein product [Linum tenue]
MVPASYSNVGLVGIERRMNEIEQWVTSGSKNLTIGLWGTGGIGKTTLAKAFYDRFSSQFEVLYFWSDFSDQLSASSHLRDGLQNDFFSRLLGDENAGRISRDLKDDRLGRTRALVVIDDVGDDVGDIRHLNNLFNGRYCDLFAPGSIIILTSRNKQVLKNVCRYVYEVAALDQHEALLLFCLSAFKEHCPPIEYEEWSKRVITYAEGNPLALTTLGSHLYGRDRNFWDIELRALEHHPNQSLERVFRRIYDGLGQIEKNAFLDIACLYGRYEVSVKELERLLDGNYVEHGLVELPLSILHLPKLENLRLDDCTSLELNALGYYTDVNKKDDRATAAIFPKLERLNLTGTSIQNQKLEELEKLTWCGEISANDQELVHLCDLIFQSKALVVILLSNCIRLKELPEILVPMEALSRLDLDGCINLSRLPDSISNLVQLEELTLSRTAIQELPATIGDLACLEGLYLDDCKSLKHLCDTIHKLSKLHRLGLSGCNQLSHLPELPSSLTWLEANGCTALQTMSISRLSKHNFLMCGWNFGNCEKLDSYVCSMLFNKFTQDALGTCTEMDTPWLLLPRGWNSPDGWRPSGLNSVVTATLGRLWQLKGLIYCASFHTEVVHQPIHTTSSVSFRVYCHNLSSTGGGDVITASSSEAVPIYRENLDSEDDRGSNLLIWYDSEVSWMAEVLVPLDSSSAGLEITVTDDATIKFVFQGMRRAFLLEGGGSVEIPIIVETCGVIPVYDNREIIIIDDDDS